MLLQLPVYFDSDVMFIQYLKVAFVGGVLFGLGGLMLVFLTPCKT